jgi:exonuclease SbcC
MKLILDNFGPIAHADLDLEGLGLAAVVGPNGAGKSTTFTIAPIWALFGTTKNGCSADNLIKLGSDTGSVCFEFEHRGERYKVIRTRSTNGKGKSSLELQRLAGDFWVPSSGATIRETEEKIVALLGLDSDTLVSSSMILQGRANEFTQKAPGERKYILSQILGLDDYEVLQAKAKEKVTELSRKIEDIKSDVARRGEMTAEKGQYVTLLEDISGEIKAVTEEAERCEAELKLIRSDIARLDNAQADMDKLKVNLAVLNRKNDAEVEALVLNEGKVRRCREYLDKEQEIIDTCAKFDRAEKILASLEPLLKQQEDLTSEKRILISNKAKNEAALPAMEAERGKLLNFLSRSNEYREAEEQIAEKTAEIEQLEAKMLDQYQTELEINSKQSKIALMWAEFRTKREGLETEHRTLTQKTALLENAGCVDVAAAKNAPCSFLKDAAEASKRLPEVKKALSALSDADIRVLEVDLSKMKEQSPHVNYAEDIAVLKSHRDAFRELADKARLIPEKEKMLAAYEAQIREKNEVIQSDIKRSDEITEELNKILGELSQVQELKASLSEAGRWREAKEQLPVMKERLARATEQIVMQQAGIETLSAEIREMNREISKLDELLTNSTDMRVKSIRLESAAEACNNIIKTKAGERAVCEQKLKEIKQAETEIADMALNLVPLSEDYEAYSLLVKAFGRDGIPALIIESAVPELEIIANEILGAMSNGRHSLEFRTQRELKSRSGMAETLDIIVRDWAGERPYETFSGGEQLRIDYAIRFALAELLTRKAGSRIEWLVIDEGLGSQDKEHRDLVLEAIRNVAGRFKKVFVITHVEEAQGAFQQQIRFESTQNGIEISTQ